MKTNFLTVLIFLMSLYGCSTPIKTHKKEATSLIVVEQPHWINAPTLENYLAVTASAMPQKIGGLEGQRRAAVLRAKARLAKSTKIAVEKSLVIKKNNIGQTNVSHQIKTHATGLQRLTHAKIKAEWINPKNGELFIWYIVDLK